MPHDNEQQTQMVSKGKVTLNLSNQGGHVMDGVPRPVTEQAPNVEKHIESYPTQIREIIEKMRSITKGRMPGAHEFLYHDAINYKLPDSPGTWICYISPQRNYVRLGFFFGNKLTDPINLIEGTGKRMRHVKVRTVGEASTDYLADLIRQAWADATNAGASLNEKSRMRQTEGDQ